MKAVVLVVPAMLAACVQTPPPAVYAGPCVVDEALRIRFAGAKYDSGMRDEMLARAKARVVRVLRQGDMATMDLREDRLNVKLDDGGRIDGLNCG